VKKLVIELEQVKRSGQRTLYHQGCDVDPINIAHSSSHEDFDDEEGRLRRRRRHARDNLRDLKVEATNFDGNLNLENYLAWV